MRLVDGEEIEADPPQPLDETLIREALRRDVEQRGLAADEVEVAGVLLVAAEVRVDERCRDADLLQPLDLVLHEGDQRRHDERPPRIEGGEDVAQALAAARRHNRENVAVVEEAQDIGLAATEVRVTEDLAHALAMARERVVCGGCGGRSRHAVISFGEAPIVSSERG